MKRNIIALPFLATLLMMACSTDPRTAQIEAAAQGYLDAMGDYRINDAAPYATRHTREHTIPAFNFIMSHSDTTYINSNRPATITIQRTEILSDTSAKVFYHKSTPIKEVDDSVTVLLENGQWLVNVIVSLPPLKINKDSLMNHREPNPNIKPIPLDSLPEDFLERHKFQK